MVPVKTSIALQDHQLKLHNKDMKPVAQDVRRLPLVSKTKLIRNWMIVDPK